MERNHWSAKTGISEVGTYWRPLQSCGGGLPKNSLSTAARKYLILWGWKLADIAAHKQMIVGGDPPSRAKALTFSCDNIAASGDEPRNIILSVPSLSITFTTCKD